MTVIFALIVTVPTLALGSEKVTICHYPPGNSDNPHTIFVNESTLDEHLAHGDQLGECPCPATPCPTEVKVVNDESDPVPISGETTVSGSVNIEGTPNVNVVNDSSNPVPITGETTVSGSVNIEGTPSVYIIDDKIPLQATMACEPPSCGDAVIYTVPSDRMCVIEYFSCYTYFSGASTSGVTLVGQIATTADGNRIQHSIPLSTGLTMSGHLSTGQMIRMYADPGTAISVDAYLSGVVVTFPEIHASISGYCVEVNTP
jgi:hypothetical protein